MKSFLVLGVAAVAVAVAGVFGSAGVSARPVAHVTLKTVTVAMHDPGCHWFKVGTTLRRTLTVRGPVSLLNYDEAALKIVGPSGTKHDGMGHRLTLRHGTYRITMVGQKRDDNTLKLVVR